MNRALLALPLLALTFVAACDGEAADEEFRGEALDVNLQLFQESGDGDGTVIWDIKEVGVHEGDPMLGAELLLTLGPAGEIYDADGVHTCTLKAPYLNKKLFQVTSVGSDQILYTVYQNYLLKGMVEPAKLTDGNIRRLLADRLLFTFAANEVYLGDPAKGHVLVSSDVDLTTQSLNRKLLIGALIEGECGSNGLGGY